MQTQEAAEQAQDSIEAIRKAWADEDGTSASNLLHMDKVKQAVEELYRTALHSDTHLKERVRLHALDRVQHYSARRAKAVFAIDRVIGNGDHPKPQLLAQFTKLHTLLRTWVRVVEKLEEGPVAALRAVRAEAAESIRQPLKADLVEGSYGHAAEVTCVQALEKFLAASNYVGD